MTFHVAIDEQSWRTTSAAEHVQAYFYFFFFFNNCIVPIGISPVGNSGCLPRGKPAATQSRYPTYGACCLVFQCLHNPPNSDVDYGIFNVRTKGKCNAIAHGGGDVRTHVRESALKVDSTSKIPCRTGESNLRRRRAGPML